MLGLGDVGGLLAIGIKLLGGDIIDELGYMILILLLKHDMKWNLIKLM